MPKVVIDTSVFIAGIKTRNTWSSSAQVIQKWKADAFTLVMSPVIMRELMAKLIEKNVSDEAVIELTATIGRLALFVPGAYESTRFYKSDASDNMFLAASYESHADWLVSLDKKSILKLKYFHGTQIRTPDLFLREILGSAQQ